MAIRYPRANLETDRARRPARRAGPGRDPRVGDRRHAPGLRRDASATCLRVAERLRERYGLRVGVVNARFVKPLDRVDDRQGDRGVRLRADRRGRLPDGRLRLGGARSGQRRRAAHRATSAGWACPTATSCTPSATSSSPRSASTSTASPRRPWTWPGAVGLPIPELDAEPDANGHGHRQRHPSGLGRRRPRASRSWPAQPCRRQDAGAESHGTAGSTGDPIDRHPAAGPQPDGAVRRPTGRAAAARSGW